MKVFKGKYSFGIFGALRFGDMGCMDVCHPWSVVLKAPKDAIEKLKRMAS